MAEFRASFAHFRPPRAQFDLKIGLLIKKNPPLASTIPPYDPFLAVSRPFWANTFLDDFSKKHDSGENHVFWKNTLNIVPPTDFVTISQIVSIFGGMIFSRPDFGHAVAYVISI